ncbi:MAG TPA: ubiquinol-cytochrome c reductase iron-sulfur subunit [Pyrinomonadaceae bacterium]|nr:ubiquinol-cytochrome c reductase iron-sulfur subunit [Pyrinomonadaceae bacterium]
MNRTPANARPEANKDATRGRRNFLLAFPFLVFAGVISTVAAAAFRFLRPLAPGVSSGAGDDPAWTTLAPLAELRGAQPIMREVGVERVAGWTSEREERRVYVLPQDNNRVLSTVCPHEGCEVVWRERENDFVCPCHDSYFNARGERTRGPARQDLAQLPARVENGVLQIRLEPSASVAEERPAVRG